MKIMEKWINMTDEEYKKELEEYKHPLLIGSTRYLFKVNPFVYAKERTTDYFPNLVEERAMDIFYKKGIASDGKTPDYDECFDEAKGSLIVKVLRTEAFKEDLLKNLEWIRSPMDLIKKMQELNTEKEEDLEL